MARLPATGADNGVWGDILNDFLKQSHNDDGSLKSGTVTDATIASSAGIAKNKLAASVQASLTAADTAVQKDTIVSNAKDHGVTGNGTTDDTAALNAWLAGLSGKIGFLPTGIYKVSGALSIPNNTTLYGSGDTSTIISQTSLAADTLTGTNLIGVSIKDLRIQGPNTGSGRGIAFSAAGSGPNNRISITNVYVRQCGGDGIYIENPIIANLDQVVAESNLGHGINLVSANGLAGTSCRIKGYANNNARAGYRLSTIYYSTLDACASDANGINYEIISCQSITAVGCGSESPANKSGSYPGHGWKISGGYGISLKNPWLDNTAGVACWVTNNAVKVSIEGYVESSAGGTETNSIRVDSGCKVIFIGDPNVLVANNLASGSTAVIGGMHHVLHDGTVSPAANAGAGTGAPSPTVTSGSSDARGTIHIGTGTGTAAGQVVGIGFAAAYASTPVVMITPLNQATAQLAPYVSVVDPSFFVVSFSSAPAASQSVGTYKLSYAVIG